MDDIQKRAHDFAIAAMHCKQSAENTDAQNNNRRPKYDWHLLMDTYFEAYDAMEAELSEKHKDQES